MLAPGCTAFHAAILLDVPMIGLNRPHSTDECCSLVHRHIHPTRWPGILGHRVGLLIRNTRIHPYPLRCTRVPPLRMGQSDNERLPCPSGLTNRLACNWVSQCHPNARICFRFAKLLDQESKQTACGVKPRSWAVWSIARKWSFFVLPSLGQHTGDNRMGRRVGRPSRRDSPR